MHTEHSISRIAVVGSGYMGGGMAQCFILRGFDCVIADANEELALQAHERLVDEAHTLEEEGLFPSGSTALIRERLTPAASIEDAVLDAHYIAEVVSESLAVKEEVLGRISKAADPQAIITSNTSAIPIALLAQFLHGPERFLGAHWMNPAPFVPCVEVIPTALTSESATAAVERLLADLGKVTTRVSDVAGFVANRLQFALFDEALRMVDEGVSTPEIIDEVVSSSFGFRLPFFGPFAGADMAGLDVYVGAYESLHNAYGDRYAVPPSLLARVAEGQLGLKSGRGFTRIAEGDRDAIVRYRNRAYSALSRLRDQLGPCPEKSAE